MTKRLFCIITLLIIFFMFFNTQLHAFDLGVHLNAAAGGLTSEPYSDSHDYDDEDLSTSSFGIGLIINSAIGNEVIYNRFMIMLEGGTMTDEDDYESDITLFSVYDTLAFVLSSSDSRVIWLGPQLGLRSYSVTNEDDMDFSGFGVTLGASLGSDFILSDTTRLGVEAGVRFAGGNIETSEFDNYGKDFYGLEGFLGFSLMFRM